MSETVETSHGVPRRPVWRFRSPSGRTRGTRVPRTADAHRATAYYGRRVRLASALSRPVSRLKVPLGDALAAGLLLLGAQAHVWLDTDFSGGRPVIALQSMVVAAAVAVRRRWPLGAVAVVAIASAFDVLAYGAGESVELVPAILVGVFVVSFSVARNEPRTDLAVAGLLILLAVFWLGDLWQRNPAGEYLASLIGVGGAWLAGRVAWYERSQAARLRQALAEAERQRRLAEQAAVAAERSRIARDLHDIVAHSLTVVALQADAAEALVAHDPKAASSRMSNVRDTAQEALGEMRRVLGALREEPEENTRDSSVRELPRLIEQLRSAGASVTMRTEGCPVHLPPAVDVSAYRIVQEGLTNVRRHAPQARAEVILRYSTDGIELSVLDDGPGAPRGEEMGHGLIGMRERVCALGGDLCIGPLPDGGWRLAAVLPLIPPPAP